MFSTKAHTSAFDFLVRCMFSFNQAYMPCDKDRWHVSYQFKARGSSWAMTGGLNIYFILIISQITPFIYIYIYINIMLLKTRWRCLYCHLSASLLNIYFFLFKNATKNLSMWISYLVTEADLDPDSDSGFYPDSNTRLRLNHQIWTTSLASCTESWGNFCCWFSTIKIKSIYQGRVQGCWVKDASSLPLQVGL